MRRWPSNIRSRQRRLRPRRAQRDAQTHNRSLGKQTHRRRERRPGRSLRKSYLERARVSPEVDKYLAQKGQGFVANEPQSPQQAGARKRLPVRVSDARCPPTMPFPADPGKDSRFIGRAGLELVHAIDGNRPFVTVTAAEPTRVGRQSGNPMPAERFEEPAVESLSNNAASARSSRLAVRTRRRTSARALRAPIE